MKRNYDRWPGGRLIIATAILGVATACAPAGHATEDGIAAWAAPIQKVDDALGRKEYSAALRVWREAYDAALASPGWDGLIAAGDAYRRIGTVTGFHRAADGKAREIYLTALSRARQQGSVDGVLRVAESLTVLGDTKTVAQCMRIAEALAARDPDARADVRAFKARFGDPTLTARELP